MNSLGNVNDQEIGLELLMIRFEEINNSYYQIYDFRELIESNNEQMISKVERLISITSLNIDSIEADIEYFNTEIIRIDNEISELNQQDSAQINLLLVEKSNIETYLSSYEIYLNSYIELYNNLIDFLDKSVVLNQNIVLFLHIISVNANYYTQIINLDYIISPIIFDYLSESQVYLEDFYNVVNQLLYTFSDFEEFYNQKFRN